MLMSFLLKHVTCVYKFLKLYICGDEMYNLACLNVPSNNTLQLFYMCFIMLVKTAK